jgi:RNA recognition motif-containing protein
MGTKLFVGGLPWSITDEQLRSAFLEHGEVVEAKVVTDRQTGRSRGFGFVVYAEESQAREALALDGTMLEGRMLRVEMAKEGEGKKGGDRDRRDRS